MNYGKLSSALVAALDEALEEHGGGRFLVLVHLAAPPSPLEWKRLEELGVRREPVPWDVLPAEVTEASLSELSEQPAIRHIELSRRLRPLDHPAAGSKRPLW